MQRTKTILFAAIIAALTSACAMDSTEDLVNEWEIADSLANRIPVVEITSHQPGDSVEAPFTIGYRLQNWEVAEGGRHVQFFINGQNKGLSYHPTSLTISQIDTGRQSIRLQLVKHDFTHIQVSATIDLYVKPPPPATFALAVNGGQGSGNFVPGEQVTVSADAPEIGMEFFRWTGDTTFLAEPSEPVTSLQMPPEAISITANYVALPVSYSLQIRPILQESCINCHEAIFEPQLNTCEEVALHATAIGQRIQDSQSPMPPSGLMPQEKIDLITSWISQGAKCTD